ncbi:MAG: aldo/keto reductase [Thermomicrobiales bacterium]|nr:aldo/keto reductase [Thermomicrobiales bacterium]
MTYIADSGRYNDRMRYRRTGESGLLLPEISLGLWQNFGDDRPLDVQRAILRTAFDAGVTHFDLANNYGPPYGSAEKNFGSIFAQDFKPYRDELIISSKAGFDMWDGPYGNWGSRKYLTASLDQSLARMGLEYVDIFYHHREDPDTPIEETASALASAVQQGKALYVGVSNYSPTRTEQMIAALAPYNIHLLIHQPSYNMLNRHPEDGLFDVLKANGVGSIAYVPLAQGLLTDRYLDGSIPGGSRAARDGSLKSTQVDATYLAKARALNDLATNRGMTLAQLALAWILRRDEITSALIGASSVGQLQQNLATITFPLLFTDELETIEKVLGG